MYFNFLIEAKEQLEALGYEVVPHPSEPDEVQVINVEDGRKFLEDCFEHDLLSYETDDSHYKESEEE